MWIAIIFLIIVGLLAIYGICKKMHKKRLENNLKKVLSNDETRELFFEMLREEERKNLHICKSHALYEEQFDNDITEDETEDTIDDSKQQMNKEELIGLFEALYYDICEAIKEIFDDSDVEREVIPYLLTLFDLIALRLNKNRKELIDIILPRAKVLYKGNDFYEFVDNRMQLYGTIIRTKKCRAEWVKSQFVYTNDLDALNTIFGDFIYNPGCKKDYFGSYLIVRNIDDDVEFISVMHDISIITGEVVKRIEELA